PSRGRPPPHPPAPPPAGGPRLALPRRIVILTRVGTCAPRCDVAALAVDPIGFDGAAERRRTDAFSVGRRRADRVDAARLHRAQLPRCRAGAVSHRRVALRAVAAREGVVVLLGLRLGGAGLLGAGEWRRANHRVGDAALEHGAELAGGLAVVIIALVSSCTVSICSGRIANSKS